MPAYNKTITSPRLNQIDKHEGEHNLLGRNGNCSKCKTRFDKVDQ